MKTAATITNLNPVVVTSPESSDTEYGSLAAAFRDGYEQMSDSSKWKLKCTGRYVEDIIYRTLRRMPDNDTTFETQLGRSFTLDVTSDPMRQWFNPEEWAEIACAVPELPAAPFSFLESLLRFDGVKTTKDLRKALNETSYIAAGQAYDADLHWDMEWADQVIRSMYSLYDAPNKPLQLNNNAEDFFSNQLWATIVDRCFWNIKGITVQRKEITCMAVAERKNRNRNSTGTGNRAKMGYRVDGVVRTIEDETYEYAAMEVGKVQKTRTSSKWLNDGLKLARTLRDMLRRLLELVDNADTIMSHVQVAGVLTMGPLLQLLRICRSPGYVCLLTREKIERVPTHVADLSDLLLLLKCMLRAKNVVKSCVEIVKTRPERSLHDELFHGRKKAGPSLPWGADSPPAV